MHSDAPNLECTLLSLRSEIDGKPPTCFVFQGWSTDVSFPSSQPGGLLKMLVVACFSQTEAKRDG